jgi:ABC-type maltose transport system permease subunit
MTKAKVIRLLRRASLAVLIALALTFSMLPIVWMATTSVKSPGEFVSRQPTLIPQEFTTVHYERLWAEGFPRRLLNSLAVTVGATTISLVVGFCAAYSLTRFHFPARLDALFLLWVLLIKMVPPIVIAIPLYQVLRLLDLLNTLPGLIVVYQIYTLPYCIWLLLGFVRDVPIDIEEVCIRLLILTPMQRIALLVGHLSGSMVVGAVQAVVVLGVGVAAGAHIATGIAGGFVIVVLCMAIALTFSSVGAFIAARTGSAEATQSFFPLFFVFFIFSSFFMPRDFITVEWFKQIATYNPASYMIEALRVLVTTGWDGRALAGGVVAVGAIAGLGIGGASLALRTRFAKGG